MHGDSEVSLKELARQTGSKSVQPCEVRDAQRFTGYLVGGISPFGAKRSLPVYVEETILELPRLYINGSKRGFILEMASGELARALNPRFVHVGR
jgi:Cys-tRNA(Pro) deacylase